MGRIDATATLGQLAAALTAATFASFACTTEAAPPRPRSAQSAARSPAACSARSSAATAATSPPARWRAACSAPWPATCSTQRDRQIANEAAQQTFETAPTAAPAAGRTPTPELRLDHADAPYQQPDGTYCREFTQEVVGRRSKRAGVQACRQADGTWKIVG
jgi:surface antigen